MGIAGISKDHQAVLDRFPSALKALVEAELAAGNTIIEAGAGQPAPPAGDMIKLAQDLITYEKTPPMVFTSLYVIVPRIISR